jgi:integrase
MSNTTLNRVIERIGYGGKFSAHGFRGTASTILNEKGYPSDYIEKQLAHAPKDQVRASYNHAQHLTQRKAMLQDWADFIDDLCKRSFTNSISSQAT